MKVSPQQAAPVTTSVATQQSPVQSTDVGGASSPYIQSAPTQTAPAPAPVSPSMVPKGQLERTRANLPQGWSNDGGHNGFKPANISQVAEGYYLAAVNKSDVPRGRQ